MKNKKFSVLSASSSIILNLIPAIYSITCIVPVVWIFYSTFKTMPEFAANVLALPKSFLNIANYEYVFTKVPLMQSMFNTIRITVFVLFFVLLFSFINGYFIARFKFTFRKFITGLYTCGLLIPIHATWFRPILYFHRLKLTITGIQQYCLLFAWNLQLLHSWSWDIFQQSPGNLRKQHILTGVRLHGHCLQLFFPLQNLFWLLAV